MDRKKKMLYGGIAAGVALVLVVVVTLIVHFNHNPCIPSKIKPNVSSILVKNVAYDGKIMAVANMAGYVEFLDDNTYLPLEVDSISIHKSENKSEPNIVTLWGECQAIVIKYHMDAKNSSQYAYSGLEMNVRRNEAGSKKICDFDPTFKPNQPTSMYYSCKQETAHKCVAESADKKGKNNVASLVLNSFELELDADEKHVKEAKFGRDPWTGSCSSWPIA